MQLRQIVTACNYDPTNEEQRLNFACNYDTANEIEDTNEEQRLKRPKLLKFLIFAIATNCDCLQLRYCKWDWSYKWRAKIKKSKD